MGKSWPKNPEPIITKIVMSDYAKFGPDQIRGFPPHTCEVAHESASTTFEKHLWGMASDKSLPPRCLHRFERSIRQIMSLRTRIGLMGVPKTNLYVLTPFLRKKSILRAFFDGTKNFPLTISLNIAGSRGEHPLLVKLRFWKLDVDR